MWSGSFGVDLKSSNTSAVRQQTPCCATAQYVLRDSRPKQGRARHRVAQQLLIFSGATVSAGASLQSLEQMDRFGLIFSKIKRPSWRRFSADPFILKGAPDHNGSGWTPKPR